MFTQRDKIKELAEYMVKDENTQCLIFRNTNYVEGFELAKKMELPGTERHGKLVKGSGVMVSSKKSGTYTFYGKDALSIKNACELNRDMESLIISNHNSKIR